LSEAVAISVLTVSNMVAENTGAGSRKPEGIIREFRELARNRLK
jgi:hypothetical protein